MENKANVATKTDQGLLDGLVSGDKMTLELIFRDYYPKIETYVLKNNGNQADAKDLFHESLKIIFLQAQEGLVLHTSFAGYLTRICKCKWINELRRKKRAANHQSDLTEPISEAEVIADIESSERTLLFQQHLKALPPRCREIISLTFEGLNLKEVAEQLKLNYSFVRRRYGECTKKLTEAIQNDPIYQELK